MAGGILEQPRTDGSAGHTVREWMRSWLKIDGEEALTKKTIQMAATKYKQDGAASGAKLKDVSISLSAAIQQWVEQIGEEIESSASPRAIRQNKLYRLIKSQRLEDSIPAILKAMQKTPLVAVSIAQDIVGNRASPVQDEDEVGCLPKIVARWTQWGQEHHYLSK